MFDEEKGRDDYSLSEKGAQYRGIERTLIDRFEEDSKGVSSQTSVVQETAIPPTLLDDSFSRQEAEQPVLLNLPTELAREFRTISHLQTRGAEADLLLVESLREKAQFIAKIYRMGIEPHQEILQQWKNGESSHVVRLYRYGRSDGRAFELLEHITKGSLADLILSYGPKLDDKLAQAILRELAEAIEYVHSLDVVHRDIKPGNILVRSIEPLDLVLTDFGIASILDGASVRFTSLSRTGMYGAPETISGKVSKATDYWSLGMIIAEVISGRHPLAGLSDRVIDSYITDNRVELKDLPEKWLILCRGLLLRDSEKRFGKAEIDRWLAGDESLRVPEDRFLPMTRRTGYEYRPYKFAGNEYMTPRELALGLAEHWADAVKHMARGYITDWVRVDVRDQDLLSFIQDLDAESNLDGDAKLFRLIRRLNPESPPIYMDLVLSEESLARIAFNAKNGDKNSQNWLASIFKGNILSAYEIHSDQASPRSTRRFLAPFRGIELNWQKSVEDYLLKANEIREKGPRIECNLTEEIRGLLLLASLSPESVEFLRISALETYTDDAKECSWFKSLGNPHRANAPELVLMTLLSDEADMHTKRRKKEVENQVFLSRQQKKEKAGRAAIGTTGGIFGAAIGGGLGLVFGAITAVIPGIVIVLIVGLLWGSDTVNKLFGIYVTGCTLVGAGLGATTGVSTILGWIRKDR
jgi:serine/threonine protein kinase